MLQKEFEERTKLSISEAEYAKIDALYLACGDEIDKDVFCKLFMSFEGRLELMHMIEREKHTSDMGWDVATNRIKTIERKQMLSIRRLRSLCFVRLQSIRTASATTEPLHWLVCVRL